MSYSFDVRAKDKQEAKDKVRAAFEGVVAAQPGHGVDVDAAGAATFAFIDMLGDETDKDVIVKVNGSIYGPFKDGAYESISGASFSVNAYLSARG